MKRPPCLSAVLVLGTATIIAMAAPATAEGPRPRQLSAVPFTCVKLQDAFWTPRLETNRKVTIPHNLGELEKQGSLGGFAILAGTSEETYRGYMWGDSDVYKTIEGMAYCLHSQPDPAVEQRMKAIIATIVGAQDEDGYLFPHLQLAEPNYERFSAALFRTCETYSMGHMVESAVAHFETTGRREYLDAAVKLADAIGREYKPGGREWPSGHPQIELGLTRLYRATGDRRHLDLAASFVEHAKHTKTLWSHGKPPLAHDEALGHAVAMLYLYSGAVDVAMLSGDQALMSLMDRKWESIVGRKMYITGGVGHRDHSEGFAADYELPNRKSYSETCAAISQVMFNHRLFQAHGDAQYMDVAERALYNGFLAGVGLSGDRFFYVNPLVSDGHGKFNAGRSERFAWCGCPCCPNNVIRYLPSIPGLAYATADDQLYVNLFIAGSARVDLKATTVQLQQQTQYPWDGQVRITVDPEKPSTFALRVRIPGWARDRPVPSDLYRYDDGLTPEVRLSIDGGPLAIELDKGYAVVRRQWRKGDVVTLDMDMPVRRVVANPRVKDNAGRFAVERGPIVYCAEGADNDGKVLRKVPGPDVSFQLVPQPDMLGGIVQIEMTPKEKGDPLTLIPYYAWCHRGPNEMAVWLPEDPKLVPQPTIASTARASASFCFPSDSLSAINDQIVPPNSHDLSVPRHTFWNHLGSEEWLQYDLAASARVDAVEVYWFDDRDTGGCWVPESWQLLYRDGDEWKPVTGASSYGTEVDQFNRVTFDPVETDGLRIEIQLQKGHSGGVLEWRVHGEKQDGATGG